MATPLQLFTDVHTAISLVGLAYGIPVVLSLLKGKVPAADTSRIFVALAFLSTFTGFFFPFNGFTPAIGTGIVTMVIFGLMYLAHRRAYVGRWNKLFTGALVAQEFFLVFVTIAQSFQKIPAVHALAPTQAEPPFAIAQGINLAIFIIIGIVAIIRMPKPLVVVAKGKRA